VQVVRQDLRLNLKHFLQVCDRILEKFVALDVLQITDMLAQESVLAVANADRILQFPAYRENRWKFVLEKDRHRHITS
jgi:hypothetical protein